MNDFESKKRLGVLERLGGSVRDAMKKLPELDGEDHAIRRLEGEGWIVFEEGEEVVVSDVPSSTPDPEGEIARFVGEGGLPNPSEDY